MWGGQDFARAALELVATLLWFYFLVELITAAVRDARRTGKVKAAGR